jgi:phosphopentomutase
MGLGSACRDATGRLPPGLSAAPAAAAFGYAIERSAGKDTPSGHWEMAGTPVPFAWGFFPRTIPCLPRDLVDALVAQAGLPGILGDCHASGTEVIATHGQAHRATGKPICYTSADSVLQIAAHEDTFGLDRLYATCRIARRLCDPLNIGRVIARPFVGDDPRTFRRTAHRKDFAVPPPPGTLFERAAEAGRAVVSVGKTADIFAHRLTGEERKGASNDANLDLALDSLARLPDGGLIVANLVDFDSEYGHRRDVPGYAACLERFDRRLPTLVTALRPDDLLVVTADHGNDPTFGGTDHTREVVPVLAASAGGPAMTIGRRETFADIGATVADHLGLAPPPQGRSWLRA